MSLRDFSGELKKRNPPLYWFGWMNMFLLLAGVVLFFTDPTMITGINAWIKPCKFAASIVLYSWTFAWLLWYLPSGKRRFISWTVILCMFMEIALIYMQAFRGVRSHFNIQTPFDATVFSVMGMFIAINTLIILYTAILFFTEKIELNIVLVWAWRLGLLFFFVGGISGGMMTMLKAHTVGGPDDGPALAILNWSTVAGDVRTAHFFTLHGLQVLPFAAILILQRFHRQPLALLFCFAIAYGTFCLWLHWLALHGLPLITN